MKKPKKENLERHSDICLVYTETGGSYIEIADSKLVTLIRSAFEDDGLKIGKEFLMNEEEVKNLNENYTMEWDKEYKEVSIYYEDSAKDKLGIIELQLRIRLCSMIKQTLDGNSDWRLTIQYYDCNTKELLSAEVVR